MLSRAALWVTGRLTGMLTRTDLRSTRLSARQLAQALPRATLDVTAAQAAVAPLIEDVRSRGAAALRDAAERFDGVRPVHLRVPAAAIAQALNDLDPAVREALELSIAHNRAGHTAQVPVERTTEVVPGGTVTQRWIPVERVGLYVPGGLAVYPSSVVMNAVAAQVAGVEQIALASPPQAEFAGLPHPTILAACALLGITEVYAVGGAQAIAMLAYGADAQDDTDRADAGGEVLCRGVDVITGPGNVYVAAAKPLWEWSASTPRRALPRSPSWPTPGLTQSTWPPTCSPRRSMIPTPVASSSQNPRNWPTPLTRRSSAGSVRPGTGSGHRPP